MNEYDTVKLNKELQDTEIPLETLGAILMVFDGNPRTFLVEFFNNNDISLGTFMVKEDQVELWTPT